MRVISARSFGSLTKSENYLTQTLFFQKLLIVDVLRTGLPLFCPMWASSVQCSAVIIDVHIERITQVPEFLVLYFQANLCKFSFCWFPVAHCLWIAMQTWLIRICLANSQQKLRGVLGRHGSGPLRPLSVSWCIMVMIRAICLMARTCQGKPRMSWPSGKWHGSWPWYTRTHRVAWGALTRGVLGHFLVFAVINKQRLKRLPL